MAAAHALRDQWGAGFPGFRGTLLVQRGERIEEGAFQIAVSGSVACSHKDPVLAAAAKGMLRSLAMHRAGKAPGTSATFLAGERHPQGRAIALGDSGRSVYRIRDGVLRQVNRATASVRLTIDNLAIQPVDGGRHLPSAFSVTYRNPKTGALLRTEAISEAFVRIGGYHLPSERVSVMSQAGSSTVTRYEFRDLTLFAHAVEAGVRSDE